ncbi:MAG: alpha/beta hydrolase [Pseudomonadota bacterium]
MIRQVIFSHGLESGPWGSKIKVMAEVARRLGYAVTSVDYQGMREPQPRVDKLLATIDAQPAECTVLVGSSMGGHVATAAASARDVNGLFVLAPAFFMPGYEDITPQVPACEMHIVHGWHDDVVPVDHSIRYARDAAVSLHLVDSDHRLGSAMATISDRLETFLRHFVPVTELGETFQ